VRFAAAPANACNSGVQFEAVSRQQHDTRTAGRKVRAQCQPKATTAAGDENRSILNFHFCPLWEQ
jgi:hypothetical protein